MLLASETSIQLTNALEKLIDSGIQLGERVLGALIIFIIGKFLVNWLNRLFARILEKRKVDPSIQSFLKSMVNILLLIMLILAVIGKLGIELKDSPHFSLLPVLPSVWHCLVTYKILPVD